MRVAKRTSIRFRRTYSRQSGVADSDYTMEILMLQSRFAEKKKKKYI